MQVEAFYDLYQKYQDTETSPATETVDMIRMGLQQPFAYYYYIEESGKNIGAVYVIDRKEKNIPKIMLRIFVMPPYRNQGIAQKAICAVEKLHGSSNWELDTVLQEKGNCHLYEKMGYYRTGKTERINDKITLVFYKKD